MRKVHVLLGGLFLTVLLAISLFGCGGNSGGETQAAPPQTGDTSLFPHAELLASPTDLSVLESIVLDARTSVEEYNAGHIPGAIFAPPSDFEKDDLLLPDADLARILGEKGVTRTSIITIYDNSTAYSGTAGRLFWILSYLGCKNVTILNGGWYQWRENFPDLISTEATVPTPQTFTMQIDDTIKIATKEEVYDHFFSSTEAGYILIDMRTEAEYQNGHIPGAINFPYSKCFNPDRTILNFDDLKTLLISSGVALDKEMVVYSTKGHRSSFFYFLCRLMGYANVSSYIGSIEDWIAANPTPYPLVTGSNPYAD